MLSQVDNAPDDGLEAMLLVITQLVDDLYHFLESEQLDPVSQEEEQSDYGEGLKNCMKLITGDRVSLKTFLEHVKNVSENNSTGNDRKKTKVVSGYKRGADRGRLQRTNNEFGVMISYRNFLEEKNSEYVGVKLRLVQMIMQEIKHMSEEENEPYSKDMEAKIYEATWRVRETT